jgi:hypothetical protein
MRRVAAVVISLGATLSSPAAADPQWNASAITGVCGRGAEGSYWQDTCWYNGARAHVLFGRSRNSDVGVGPYLSVTTAGFDDLRLTGGGSLLLPVNAYLPIVLSAGAYARHEDDWTPGVSGWLFWGSHSYNFHSHYVMSGGLLLGLERDVRGPNQNNIVIAAQIDGLVLALPFLLAYDWIRGPPEDE